MGARLDGCARVPGGRKGGEVHVSPPMAVITFTFTPASVSYVDCCPREAKGERSTCEVLYWCGTDCVGSVDRCRNRRGTQPRECACAQAACPGRTWWKMCLLRSRLDGWVLVPSFNAVFASVPRCLYAPPWSVRRTYAHEIMRVLPLDGGRMAHAYQGARRETRAQKRPSAS